VKRLRRVPAIFVDSLVAVTVAALTWVTVLYHEECPCRLPWWGVALILGQSLPLAVRRRAPVAVWVVVGIMTSLYGASDLVDPPIFFGGLVSVYTVASRTSRRTSYTLGAMTAVVMFGVMAATGDTGFVTAALNVIVFATAWILGDNVRVRRAHTDELEQRAAELERQRTLEAERAAAEERVRIARELHDVVAHHVSVIALQSQAAEVLLPDDPAGAAEVVNAIGATSRQALTELRHLLGALRADSGDGPGRAPQPGLGAVGTLVESVRRAGLPVEVTTDGEARPLPPGVELSAYRIVQEALTNVLEHAAARHAWVTLRYEPDALAIRVADDGQGAGPASPTANGRGHGLIGMRERVSLFGGELRTGPGPAGGVVVGAPLPLAQP
jgi:signal transduction histidine kinase